MPQEKKLKLHAVSHLDEKLPIVYLHGFCSDLRFWEGLIAALDHSSWLTIDLPGFGKSPAMSGVSIAEMADLVKHTLDEQNITECILAGHSMGGYVALAFAEKYVNLLKGLAMVHSHPYADDSEKKAGRLKAQQFIRKHGLKPFVKQLIPGLFASGSRKELRPIISKLVDRAKNYPAEGVINALQAMHDRPDRSPVLQQIDCPVLFIIGDQDEAIPPDHSIQQTALPKIADIRILNGVGHMVPYEDLPSLTTCFEEFTGLCLE